MLSPVQTDVTLLANNSQLCWMLLRVVVQSLKLIHCQKMEHAQWELTF